VVDCVWNVMAHAQKSDFVFRRNGRVHLNRREHQFSRLLAAEVCASAVVMVVMLDTPCFEVVRRVLATHSIRQFPLHFPSRSSPCAITFQLDSSALQTFRDNVSVSKRRHYTLRNSPEEDRSRVHFWAYENNSFSFRPIWAYTNRPGSTTGTQQSH
jgi:hypothetical protein